MAGMLFPLWRIAALEATRRSAPGPQPNHVASVVPEVRIIAVCSLGGGSFSIDGLTTALFTPERHCDDFLL